jgi:chromosome segregation ATPase
MAEADIQILLTILKDLKADVNKLSDKIDAIVARCTQAETDIQNLYQANSEVRLAQKKCREEEDAKIDALTSLQPADPTEKKKFWDNVTAWWGTLHIAIRMIPTIAGLLVIIWGSCAHFFIDVKRDFKNDVKPVQTAVSQLKDLSKR